MFKPTDAGKPFNCDIRQVAVEGKLQFEDGKYYLCQDLMRGDECTDKLGFKFSWGVDTAERYFLKFHGISNFTFGKKLHYSKSFTDFLRKTFDKSKVSQLLYDRMFTSGEVINYISNRKEGISYMPADKPQVLNADGDWKTEGRQEGKPAKTARRLLTPEGLAQLTDKDFEIFANLYKSMSMYDGTFKVVSGEDIKYWYNGDNYADGQGSLSSSCMRDVPDNWFNIYAANPNQCSLLILINSDDKLIGRALLWNVGDAKYMDRIYGLDPTVEKFKMWAEDNDYYHKRRQNYETKDEWVWKGEIVVKELSVTLEHAAFRNYPYMDTFCYIRRSKAVIQNFNSDYCGHTQTIHGEVVGGEKFRGILWENRNVTEVEHSFTYKMIPYAEAIQLNTGHWVYVSESTVCHSSDEVIHIQNSFICDWSGLTYHNDYKVRTIEGETVTSCHQNIVRVAGRYTHRDRLAMCAYTGNRYLKSDMSATVNQYDDAVWVHKDFIELYNNHIKKINADRQSIA